MRHARVCSIRGRRASPRLIAKLSTRNRGTKPAVFKCLDVGRASTWDARGVWMARSASGPLARDRCWWMRQVVSCKSGGHASRLGPCLLLGNNPSAGTTCCYIGWRWQIEAWALSSPVMLRCGQASTRASVGLLVHLEKCVQKPKLAWMLLIGTPKRTAMGGAAAPRR